MSSTINCCIIGLGRFGVFWFELLYKQRQLLYKMRKSLIHRDANSITSTQHFHKHENAVSPNDTSVEAIRFLLYDAHLSMQKMQNIVTTIRAKYSSTVKNNEFSHKHENIDSNIEVTIITKDMLISADTIFLCVPISVLELQAKEILSYCNEHAIIFDTCSVKEKPVQWINASRKRTQYFMATHPLFGPDSFKDEKSRNIVISAEHMPNYLFMAWKAYFTAIGLHCLQLSPKEHDKQIAYTQGLTHLVGRILKHIPQQSYHISTKGFSLLQEIIEQTCNDSTDLFFDLQIYNKYSKDVWKTFLNANQIVFDSLSLSQKEKQK